MSLQSCCFHVQQVHANMHYQLRISVTGLLAEQGLPHLQNRAEAARVDPS